MKEYDMYDTVQAFVWFGDYVKGFYFGIDSGAPDLLYVKNKNGVRHKCKTSTVCTCRMVLVEKLNKYFM